MKLVYQHEQRSLYSCVNILALDHEPMNLSIEHTTTTIMGANFCFVELGNHWDSSYMDLAFEFFLLFRRYGLSLGELRTV
jgi:hypothetical protein